MTVVLEKKKILLKVLYYQHKFLCWMFFFLKLIKTFSSFNNASLIAEHFFYLFKKALLEYKHYKIFKSYRWPRKQKCLVMTRPERVYTILFSYCKSIESLAKIGAQLFFFYLISLDSLRKGSNSYKTFFHLPANDKSLYVQNFEVSTNITMHKNKQLVFYWLW